jgi:hypothetical protein
VAGSCEYGDEPSGSGATGLVICIKGNEVGGTCGTHGRGEKSVLGFDGKARRKETTWKTKA